MTGPAAARAISAGLAFADWDHSDGPALRDTALWLGMLTLTGAGGAATWGTWWAVPFFAMLGVLYGPEWTARSETRF